MSRLDQHIAKAQAQIAMNYFLAALGATAAALAAAVLLAVLVDRAIGYTLPRPMMAFGAAVIAGLLAAGAAALWRRPSPHAAAVEVDRKLQLREKFSSALLLRGSSDRFAVAAVADAEATAQQQVVPVWQLFPLNFPRGAGVAAVIAVLIVVALMLPRANWFEKHEQQTSTKPVDAAKVKAAQAQVSRALAEIDALPGAVQKVEAVQLAREALAKQASSSADPMEAQRTAAAALGDVDKALQEQVQANAKYAEAQKQLADLSQLADQPLSAGSPLASVQQAMAQGDLAKAMGDLDKVVANFDKLDQKQKAQVAGDMTKLAAQLKQLADSPQGQQQMQQQLQGMGMNQQQAQQATDLMRRAAAGDAAARQQVSQMAQQALSQMNNGQGPNSQQQQQLKQMLSQMQGHADAQTRAAQMSQAAQQLAGAMQQAAAPKGAQAGQQQSGQQSSGQQQASQQQSGQQNPGQQQASQQQSGQQQAGQQDSGQQQSGGMSQAGNAMDQAMAQMQAVQQDAAQMDAAREAIAEGQSQALDGLAPGDADQGTGSGDDDGQKHNQQRNDGNNPGGGHNGFGGHLYKTQAPYTVKRVLDPSQNIADGRVLASTLVKAGALRGEKREALKDVAVAAEKDAPDEVDQDRVSRKAQNVVKEYFRSMQEDAGTATNGGAAAPGEQPPTTQPGG